MNIKTAKHRFALIPYLNVSSMTLRTSIPLVIASILTIASGGSIAQSQGELNLYSARHYSTDEQLYSNFTKQTGIKINRIDAGDEAILERIRSEGAKSPADVLLLVDAARLWKAQIEGLLAPIKSTTLEAKIPATLRSKDDGAGSQWFAFSTRARVIVYNKASIKPETVANYEDLASPAMKGKVCSRSASHPYMLSLISTMVNHLGEQKAETWAAGVVANMARPPRGGDTDQIKAVAVGECGVALTNTYYWARILKSDKPEDKAIVQKVGFIWPNQKGVGAHMNVAGGAVLKNAPNRAAAVKFLEYLASDQAQTYFAEGNNEWPAVAGVKTKNPELDSLGPFKADSLSVAQIARHTVTSSKIIDRVGWR
jgi:iron(III) transport system substrate-binding protein